MNSKSTTTTTTTSNSNTNTDADATSSKVVIAQQQQQQQQQQPPPQPKRMRPRLQSGNSVRGILQKQDSARLLELDQIENRDHDLQFVRQQPLKRLEATATTN